LLPPLADLLPASTVPPKVNEGAGDALASTAELSRLTAPFSIGVSASEITVEGLSGAAMFALTSRAGAAALAAPAEATTDSPHSMLLKFPFCWLLLLT